MDGTTRNVGMLGLSSRALDGALWLATGAGFLWLMAYAMPRQPAFALFMSVLGIVIFMLALLRAEWALMLMIAVIPGITTMSVTVFNYVQPSLPVGVFGPAAYVPVMAFALGVWARAWVYREPAEPSRIRPWLLAFLMLSMVSVAVTCWRYADFWPVYNRPYHEQVVNTDSLLAGEAIRRVIWALMNYVSGPLLFLAAGHIAARARARQGAAWCGRTWLLHRIIVPLWIGSAAPFLIGRYQTSNVWFGANRVYVWPWMNRINASFFDPNALGAYLILIVPWLLAVVCLASARRWRQIGAGAAGVVIGIAVMPWMNRLLGAGIPSHSIYAYAVILSAWLGVGAALWHIRRSWLLMAPVGLACGMVMRMSVVLAGHAGSRTAVLGLIVTGTVAVLLASLQGLLKLRARVSARMLQVMVSGVCVGYVVLGIWMFYIGAPRMRAWLQKNPHTNSLPLVKRFNQLQLGSFKKLYRQIILDRGPHAKLAVAMIRDAPLTGTGLGSFLTELPNWKQREKQIIYVPDTACNYYLQIGAEQGVIALVVMLIVFGLWWRRWWQAWQQREMRLYWLWIGAGMASMLAMFIFGMHTLAAEIQALFWLYMAQVCIVADDAPRHAPSRYRAVLWALIIVIIVVQTAAQFSLAAQRQAFGWQRSTGFYPLESHGPISVRYTQQQASECLQCEGLQLVQPWACFHANITGAPVEVTFRIGTVQTNLMATDNAWHTLVLPVPVTVFGQTQAYHVTTSRTWTGRELGLNNDTRALGVALQPWKWETSNGLFEPEIWNGEDPRMNGTKFCWSSGDVRMLIDTPQPFVQLPILVPHPDVAQAPVALTYTLNDTIITTITYHTQGWHQELLFVRMADGTATQACCGIRLSRTWRPRTYGMEDARELGIGVGTPQGLSAVGLYDLESWQSLFQYAWAGATARWAQQADSNGVINVHCLLAHPDIATRPVLLEVGGPALGTYQATISNAGWHACSFQGTPLHWYELHGGVDRTWRPSDHGGGDARVLGFGVRR